MVTSHSNEHAQANPLPTFYALRLILMFPLLGSVALLPIEKVISSLIKTDSHLAAQIRRFDGKVIGIRPRIPDFEMSISFVDGDLKLSMIDFDSLGLEPDATVSGSTIDLLSLLTSPPDQRPLANKNISISGDALLIQDLYMTAHKLGIQWQDYLAPFLGDVLTNELGKLSDNANSMARSVNQSAQRSVADYLQEEARLLPDSYASSRFTDDLDHLKIQIDRAQARTKLLNERLEKLILPSI